jgi:hypothetical protein
MAASQHRNSLQAKVTSWTHPSLSTSYQLANVLSSDISDLLTTTVSYAEAATIPLLAAKHPPSQSDINAAILVLHDHDNITDFNLGVRLCSSKKRVSRVSDILGQSKKYTMEFDG